MPPLAERIAWGARKRKELDGADLVFLDPDTGIGKASEKHATFSEIRLLRKPKRAIVIITFPHQGKKHDVQLARLHERLAAETHENIVTLRTSVSVPTAAGKYVPRVRWFTVVDADAELHYRAREFETALKSVRRVTAQLDYGRGRAPR